MKNYLCVSGPVQFKPMLFKGQLHPERYILKILTDDLWVVGWGNDTGLSKEKS